MYYTSQRVHTYTLHSCQFILEVNVQLCVCVLCVATYVCVLDCIQVSVVFVVTL